MYNTKDDVSWLISVNSTLRPNNILCGTDDGCELQPFMGLVSSMQCRCGCR